VSQGQLTTTSNMPDMPDFDPVEETRMGLLEHLAELRTRLLWIVGGLLIGTVISFIFVERILIFITSPVGKDLIAIGPTDTISIFFRVGFVCGAILSMPVIVYQIVAFIVPGLYPHEKRTLLMLLPAIMLLFFIGAAFAYFIMLPVAVGFLQNFLGTVISQEWTIDRYINLVTRIVFWIGVFFEMPLIIAFLARIGLVTGPKLLGYWRHAIVANSIIAAIITPTVDPVNMTIVMAPLIVLYFIGVGLAYILYRPREPRDFSD
jgi:sec-independent protein translocase protein TatC